MKPSHIFIACTLLSMVLFSCNKENEKTGSLKAITGEASHISCRNAVLSGTASLPSSTASNLKIGILYDTNSGVLYGNAKAIEASSFDSSYNFSVTSPALEPETTYYYRTYIFQNSEVTYGETKSFKTAPVNSMLKTSEPSGVDASVATLNAVLNLTDCVYTKLEYGFKLTSSEGSKAALKAENLKENAYSLYVTDLLRNQLYEVTTYAILDGKEYLGDKKSFTTQSVKASVSVNAVTDIEEFSASVSGKVVVSSEGSYDITAQLYYSDTFQTASDLIQGGVKKSLSVEGDGNFSQIVSELHSATKYYALVVAVVDGVEVLSDVISFTTSDYTASFKSITYNTMEHSCSTSAEVLIESKGQMDVSVWFLYSETASDAESLKSNGKKGMASQSGENEFEATLTELAVGTKYYFMAIGRAGEKEIESDVMQFETCPVDVTASLLAGATATEMSLSIYGKVTSNMKEPFSNFKKAFKVFYSATSTTPEAIVKEGNGVEITLDDNNAFVASLNNLASNQNYNCVVESTIDDVQVLGGVQQYSTAKINASATTSDAQDVKYTRALLSGEFTLNTSLELSQEAYFLYSDKCTTLDDLVKTGTKAIATISGGSFSSQLININDGSQFSYVACVKIYDTVFYGAVKSFSTIKIPAGGVDLGLSVLWHQQNVGASSPEDYGSYFAWGETEAKARYSLDNYKWIYVDGNYKYSKYNSWPQYGVVDNKKELELIDDAARAILGNDWRTPTYDEIKELVENCTWQWTTQNGVKGGLFTSSVTGNSIFLPAAGQIADTINDYKGTSAKYMSSTLGNDYPDSVRVLWFSDFRIEPNPTSVRHIGISIRPVHD